MQLITIVEDYVVALMKRAQAEVIGDAVVATVPDAPGVVASGADQHDCATDLYRRLEDWVRVFVARGYELPIIDGIDLNGERGRSLAGYHGGSPRPLEGEFFEDENALEAAFTSWEADS